MNCESCDESTDGGSICFNCMLMKNRLPKFLISEINRREVIRMLAKHEDFERLLDQEVVW